MPSFKHSTDFTTYKPHYIFIKWEYNVINNCTHNEINNGTQSLSTQYSFTISIQYSSSQHSTDGIFNTCSQYSTSPYLLIQHLVPINNPID